MSPVYWYIKLASRLNSQSEQSLFILSGKKEETANLYIRVGKLYSDILVLVETFGTFFFIISVLHN